jgi:hypothetical protein
MSTLTTFCPRCQRSLDIPMDFDSVICAGCATAYTVRRRRNAINLLETGPQADVPPRNRDAIAVIDSRLAEIEQLIEEAESEIESLRSIEQSVPLQKGCAFFGLFTMVIVVIVLFMLLGRGYFGSWLFFAAVAAVILLGLARMRRKLAGSAQLEDLQEDRRGAEHELDELRTERDRVLRLKASLTPQTPTE